MRATLIALLLPPLAPARKFGLEIDGRLWDLEFEGEWSCAAVAERIMPLLPDGAMGTRRSGRHHSR